MAIQQETQCPCPETPDEHILIIDPGPDLATGFDNDLLHGWVDDSNSTEELRDHLVQSGDYWSVSTTYGSMSPAMERITHLIPVMGIRM